MVVKYGLEKKILFSSFNHFSLIRLKEIVPAEMELGALVEHESGVKVFPGAYCEAAGFKCYHPPIALEKLYTWDVEGIITNFPSVPMAWLAARRS